MQDRFHRNELLLGSDGVETLARTRVILFGVGGVGSWCAEALIRSGVGHLTIVDEDVVASSNLNRQVQATAPDLGRPKVEALRDRLLSIVPDAEVVALQMTYNFETSTQFDLNAYDYVIDAIDTLSHKVGLIVQAMASRATLYSAMGAACKLDAGSIRIASIWDSKGCRLARFVRKRLRRMNTVGECICVYSEELLPLKGTFNNEVRINGSMVHITGSYGFRLAGLVVQDVYRRVHGT